MNNSTITLPTPYTFLEAIAALDRGECLGIRPQTNSNYMTMFYPGRGGNRLVWSGNEEGTALVDQFQGEWFLVIIDHREKQSRKKP